MTAFSHPRPQFRRSGWTDLCGTWRFAFDDADEGLAQHWYAGGELDLSIQVPYPPESKLSEVGDTSFHPVVWYAREFETPELTDGRRLLLHFGAVDYYATVWVNGVHVGEHAGGQTPFGFDVTDVLDLERAGQTVVVRAEDRPTDLGQPRGKQVWTEEPHGIFYDRTTGIWQPVWLEVVAPVHIAELAWTTDLEAGFVHLDVGLDRQAASPRTLEVSLSHDGGLLAAHSVRLTGTSTRITFTLDELTGDGRLMRLLWSPESPTLLDAEIVLTGAEADATDAVEDRIQSYVGLRSCGFRDGLFLLNGRPYYLRMALEQGFWPQSHLAAPDAGALRREVELAKELGFTGVRIHQKVEDPRFLYWCDRLGLLVWGEFGSAYVFSDSTTERTVREWLDVVRRDRSHPCVVAWVPFNESWGLPQVATSRQQQDFVRAVYHLTKALDPTRPVISNDGWEHVVSDIWGVHDYAPSGESLRRRYGTPEALERTLHGPGPGRRAVHVNRPKREGQPVVITEFGGLSYRPEAGQKWFGYGTVESPEQLRDNFADLVSAILDCEDVAGFCYTQLTDTQQERNGLLTEDREPKVPLEEIRAILQRPSRAIPAEDVDVARRAARSQG
ncbi:glycoside hydrolase family 2 protein [Flindersiella endophytica]